MCRCHGRAAVTAPLRPLMVALVAAVPTHTCQCRCCCCIRTTADTTSRSRNESLAARRKKAQHGRQVCSCFHSKKSISIPVSRNGLSLLGVPAVAAAVYSTHNCRHFPMRCPRSRQIRQTQYTTLQSIYAITFLCLVLYFC
jgi:hypothetical protein